MKLNFKDKRVQFGTGFLFGVIAFIDSLIVDAANFSDLHWWGLVSAFIMMGTVALFGVYMMIIPLFRWITKKGK
jgi:hypothetical protein